MALSQAKGEEISRMMARGEHARAEAELVRLARVMGQDAAVAGLLTRLYMETDRLEQAVFAAERRAAIAGTAGAQADVVSVLGAAGRHDEAIARARRLAEKGGASGATALAAALLGAGRVAEVVRFAEELERAGQQSPDVQGMRASALMVMGRAAEAVAVLRELLARYPGHPSVLSLLASAMNYTGAGGEESVRVHAAYGAALEALAERGPAPVVPRALEENGKRRVPVVGMVSADFREHSVSRFAEPIFRHADRERVRVVGLSIGARPDGTTARLAGLADAWREVRPRTGERLREVVAAERVDVLIELGGHMVNSALALMCPRVAAVQGSAIGYPNTTGLKTIDFRMVDSITDPPGASDRFATERLVRIDPCFLCYQAPEDAPGVGEPARERNGFVTFGSFNAISKVGDELLSDWAELLGRVAGSRLLVKSPALDDAGTRADFEARARRAGISAERLELAGKRETTREHLAEYGRVDVALDTYPYHGTTTTCEALWMGVPVVTRAGEVHASRVGASLLNAAGMREMVAGDREGYVRIAAELAGDVARLRELRAGLRERVRGSVLCDGAAYAKRWVEGVMGVVGAVGAGD